MISSDATTQQSQSDNSMTTTITQSDVKHDVADRIRDSNDDKKRAENQTTDDTTNTPTISFDFEIDIKSMQNHMKMLNNNIDHTMDNNKKSNLLNQLFGNCPISIGKNNSYFITNWLLNIIKNSFVGIKICQQKNNNKIKQRFSLYNQMNLQCIKYLLDNGNKLKDSIDLIITQGKRTDSSEFDENKGSHDNYVHRGRNSGGDPIWTRRRLRKRTGVEIVQGYLQQYTHKCQENDYFNGNKMMNGELTDILRNILFEIAISHRIFDDIEQLCDGNDNDNDTRGRRRVILRRYGHNLQMEDVVPMMIEKYLDLGLLDLSIVVHGMSLYHLLIYRKRENGLKLLLQSAQCDWSMFIDNTNQV